MNKANSLNFSGGPGALPDSVLKQTQQAIIALPETGLSVLGMSHRTHWFRALVQEAEDNIRALLGVGREYKIAFMQGGSSLQFALLPMSFAHQSKIAPAYVTSGYWSGKAVAEAARIGSVNEVWNGQEQRFRTLPQLSRLDIPEHTPYLHYISNETVEGLQFRKQTLPVGVPLIADMSSDFLSRPCAIEAHSMVYAHAQKNLGPSGITLTVVHESMLDRIPAGMPAILDMRTHIEHASNYNTPPVFAIYVLTLVTRWMLNDIGGLEQMGAINRRKAATLYAALDRLEDVVELHAQPEFRSDMNVAFTFRDASLTGHFLKHARDRQMSGLEGHRSLGGLRVSLYNAVTQEAVDELAAVLLEFCHVHA